MKKGDLIMMTGPFREPFLERNSAARGVVGRSPDADLSGGDLIGQVGTVRYVDDDSLQAEPGNPFVVVDVGEEKLALWLCEIRRVGLDMQPATVIQSS